MHSAASTAQLWRQWLSGESAVRHASDAGAGAAAAAACQRRSRLY